MCSPPAIVMALSMASTATGLFAQRQAANAQLEALETQRQAQAEELSAQAEQRMGERVKKARRERARLRVAAGEAGIAGASFEAVLADSFAQQNQDLATIAKNVAFADRASQARFRSAVAQVDRPTLVSSALQIGLSGAQGFQSGLQIQAARPAPTPAPVPSGEG